MSIITLIEQLASSPHYNTEIYSLINKQPEEVKKAFHTNDTELLRKQFLNSEHLAHTTTVVQA